jgi:uncharacterized DUF497 family protein
VPGDFEFDWDAGNIRHLGRHKITPREFEEVLLNDPLDLEYQTEGGEDRYKSLGATRNGRILIAVWTIYRGKIRAVTAYPATKPYKELYRKYER